ncbi:MAG: TMEM175 family protein [Anaerolineales bacterium]
MLQPETEPPILTNRIEAFSDGVIAIVVTLLVLELRVPHLEGADTAALSAAVAALAPKFLSFVMSFVFVAVFWVAHHQLYHPIERSTPTLLWLNNIFLLCLTFIPFPTAMLGEYPDNPFAVTFFGAAMLAASLSFSLMRWYATLKASLAREDIDLQTRQRAMRRSLIGPGLYLAGIIVTVFNTALAISIYLVIPLLYLVPVRLGKK